MTVDRPILVVGASGGFARLVIPALVERGALVRGMVRDASHADGVRHAGAKVVIADLTDQESLAVALRGVERVFYISPAFMPNEPTVGRQFVAQAEAAGVKRIVFSSVIHPVIAGLPNHAAKAQVEEAILDSGLEYTFLHPALFFQNYIPSWDRIVETGILAEPWSVENRFSRVDYRDVADVAAVALTDDSLCFGTFELCADGWLNRHEVAALVAQALGRGIKAERTDPASLGASAGAMLPMFEHYDRVGLRGNCATLRALLGREPRSLANFFDELASRGTSAKPASP